MRGRLGSAIRMVLPALLAFNGHAGAADYASCLLEKMPSSQNYPATVAIIQLCGQRFPGGYSNVWQGAGRNEWFGYHSGLECAAAKAAGTVSAQAAVAIRRACNCLYNPPTSNAHSCQDEEDHHR